MSFAFTGNAYMVAAVSLATPVFLFFMEQILKIVGTSGETYQYTKSYLIHVEDSFSGIEMLFVYGSEGKDMVN